MIQRTLPVAPLIAYFSPFLLRNGKEEGGEGLWAIFFESHCISFNPDFPNPDLELISLMNKFSNCGKGQR